MRSFLTFSPIARRSGGWKPEKERRSSGSSATNSSGASSLSQASSACQRPSWCSSTSPLPCSTPSTQAPLAARASTGESASRASRCSSASSSAPRSSRSGAAPTHQAVDALALDQAAQRRHPLAALLGVSSRPTLVVYMLHARDHRRRRLVVERGAGARQADQRALEERDRQAARPSAFGAAHVAVAGDAAPAAAARPSGGARRRRRRPVAHTREHMLDGVGQPGEDDLIQQRGQRGQVVALIGGVDGPARSRRARRCCPRRSPRSARWRTPAATGACQSSWNVPWSSRVALWLAPRDAEQPQAVQELAARAVVLVAQIEVAAVWIFGASPGRRRRRCCASRSRCSGTAGVSGGTAPSASPISSLSRISACARRRRCRARSASPRASRPGPASADRASPPAPRPAAPPRSRWRRRRPVLRRAAAAPRGSASASARRRRVVQRCSYQPGEVTPAP